MEITNVCQKIMTVRKDFFEEDDLLHQLGYMGAYAPDGLGAEVCEFIYNEAMGKIGEILIESGMDAGILEDELRRRGLTNKWINDNLWI